MASVCGSGGYSSFSYGVVDPNTGDIKDQHEKRVGDSVVGKYSLIESDGSKRIVEYEASAGKGFNAIVRKEPTIVTQPSGPIGPGLLGLGPLVVPANQSVGPANQSVAPPLPSLLAPAQADPIISANATPIVPVGSPDHPEQMGQPSSLPLPDANIDLSGKPRSEVLPAPGTLPHPGTLVHPSSQVLPGTLPGNLAPLPGALINQPRLVPSGAVSHQTVFAQHGFGQRDVLPYPDANSFKTYPAFIDNSRFLNPYVNQLSDNFVRPGYTDFAGANRLANPISGPQGVPAVSHFSNSIVHEATRAYPRSHAFGYNGAYGGPYGGSNGGYGRFGAHGQPGVLSALGQTGALGAQGQTGAFGTPLSHGPADFLSHGVGPYGVAHSYTSLTRGEAYPHGYGGYGSRFNGANGADVGAGLPW